ncbi:MAG: hypothetical protein ACYDGR_00255 [Candidatus Dormibacteria bacterium]
MVAILEEGLTAACVIPFQDVRNGPLDVLEMSGVPVGHSGTASSSAALEIASIGSSGSSRVWTGTPSNSEISSENPLEP